MAKLTLPARKTAAIVVDPLHDFLAENSVFERRYGKENIQPLRELLPRLQSLTSEWRAFARMILCRSSYRPDEFANDDLYDLCTTEEGRTSLIDRRLFHYEFTKTANSVFSAGHEVRGLLSDRRYAIFTGLTTTSCVKKSVEESGKELPDYTIVVPRNAVASRSDRQQDEQDLLDKWDSDEHPNVIVPDSWQDIKFR